MRTNKIYFFLLVFLFLMFLSSNIIKAQEFKLITKDAVIIDDKIVVNFDFTKFKKKQRFNILLEVKNSSGELINAKSLSGDVGKNIVGGENKKIIWDYLVDNIVIDDEISFEIKAQLHKGEEDISKKPTKTVLIGKALLLSAIFPGWGQAKIKQRKSYLLLGLITYGAAAASFAYHNNSYNNYSKYLNDETHSSESNYFSKSESQKALSKYLLYGAASAWTLNMIWTVITSSKNNKVKVSANINPYFKSTELTFSYKF